MQRHSRLIDDGVAEAQVEPAGVRQFELSSTARFRTGSSDKVYEKSIGSRFDKVSDDDIEKIIAEQKKTEIQRMRLTNGLEFSRTSVSPTATV